MQWHWGNIGSAIAGASALVIAIAALIRSPSALRDWKARQRAEADAAYEQAESTRLERRSRLSGWSSAGVDTFPVALVSDYREINHARDQLADDRPSVYVVLRVTGNEHTGANLAMTLRHVIEDDGYISRRPSIGEIEALEIGLDRMRIPRMHGGEPSTEPRDDRQA